MGQYFIVLKNQLRWKRLNAKMTQRMVYLKSTQECRTDHCGPKELMSANLHCFKNLKNLKNLNSALF